MIDAQFSLSADETRSIAVRFGDAADPRAAWIRYLEFERRGDLLLVRVVYRPDRPAGVPHDLLGWRDQLTGNWEFEQEEQSLGVDATSQEGGSDAR